MNKPTPCYDEISKEVKAVHARIAEFVRKYPDYNEYLSDEHVIFKAQVDYRMSISDRPDVRRSYVRYFNDLYSDTEYGKDKDDPQIKERLETIKKGFSAYHSIRQCILQMQRTPLSGILRPKRDRGEPLQALS